MPDTTDIDVKPTDDSSSSVAPASEGQTTDVNTQSDSSSEASSTKPALTMEDAVKAALDKRTSSPDVTEQDKEPEKDATEVENQDKAKTQTEDKGPIPYERFAEVNTAKVKLEQEFAQVKPLVESYNSIHNFLQENNVSPEEFQNWMNIAALFKKDPAAALESLKPHLQVMQGYTGESLDRDLQEAVDNSEISLKYAKELMSTRTKSKFAQQQTLQTQQQSLQQQQQQHFQRLSNTLNSWVANKTSSIPEFKAKTNEAEADGMYEFFLNKFANDARVAQPKSEQELINIAEKALQSVQAALGKFAPKPPNGSKHVRSSQSNIQAPREPKTLDEAIAQKLAARGISYTPRS